VVAIPGIVPLVRIRIIGWIVSRFFPKMEIYDFEIAIWVVHLVQPLCSGLFVYARYGDLPVFPEYDWVENSILLRV
jgi:hypothetical protein